MVVPFIISDYEKVEQRTLVVCWKMEICTFYNLLPQTLSLAFPHKEWSTDNASMYNKEIELKAYLLKRSLDKKTSELSLVQLLSPVRLFATP